MNAFKKTILFCLPFVAFYNIYGQISFFGNLYLGKRQEVHKAFPKTYFAGGKIITERNTPKGILSFNKEIT